MVQTAASFVGVIPTTQKCEFTCLPSSLSSPVKVRGERHKAEEACDNSAKFDQLCLLAIVLIEKLCASLLNNYGHPWLCV